MEPDDLHQNLFHINKMSFAFANQNVVFLPWECFPSRRAPTFLAPLDGACRVSAPPDAGGKRLWKSSLVKRFPPGLSQYHILGSLPGYNHPKNVWFFFQPGLLVFLLVPLVPVIRRRQSGILPKWQISLNLTIIRLKVCMANWLISCGNALILVTQHSIHDLLWSMLHHLPSWKNPQPNVFQSLFHPTKRNGHESNFAD